MLLMPGCASGAAVVEGILPWLVAVEHLQEFGGAGEIPNDPIPSCRMRMPAGAFAIKCCIFLLCAG